MAKFVAYSGGKGRPLSIDPEAELERLIYATLPKAQQRLEQFRTKTKGVRDPSVLGSETELPDFIETSIDILSDLREGNAVSYQTLKELKQNLKMTEQLASRQERVYGRSLDKVLTEEYFKDLDFVSRNSSDVIKTSNQKIKQALSNLTPRQRQEFFMSKHFEDPKTMTGSYEKVKAWAKKETDQELTMQESWAYLRERRLADGLGVSGSLDELASAS